MNVLEAKSFAKINLYLDVGERRGDGFHDIETIFQTIDLADALRFELRDEGITLNCDHAQLDTGPSNLVQRAALALQSTTGCAKGVAIALRKRIPVAAGLAGGSGNAAATLVALNRLWDLNLSVEELSAIAVRLGSDIPYCLRGGTMSGRGRGEILERLSPIPPTYFVLVHPAIEVSTASVYNAPGLSRRPMGDEASEGLRDAINALGRGDWPQCCFNAMESVVFQMHPALAEIRRRLLDAGCGAAIMSGSGPTVFGVVASREIGEAVAGRLGDFDTTVAGPVGDGVSFLR